MSIYNDAYINPATKGEEEQQAENNFTRKRKQDGNLSSIDRRPFTIRTNTADPFAKPQTFTPLCLLPRSNLPLAYLDTAQGGSRVFAAHVQVLEACHDYQDEARVLVIEDGAGGRLYAVERVQRRKYALCRLGAWVKIRDVEQRSSLDLRLVEVPRKRHALSTEKTGQPWWMSAAVDMKKDNVSAENIWGQLPNLCMQKAAGQSTALPGDAAVDQTDQQDTSEIPDPKPSTPEEALEELTKHYLDALYLSKTPLAFFAKGPLARARAALAHSPTELVTFLRASILSSSVMDKKFREVIAEHVKEMPIFTPDGPAAKPKPRRKRKWKPKRDKSGLFVDEKDHVEQWWQKDDDTGSSTNAAESIDAVLKQRSPRLRNRETFLQIILILETMALEAALPLAELASNAETQGIESQGQESQAAEGEKRSRKKKETDITGTLESLIDRLCIWYSLETTSPVKTGANGSGDIKDETSDDLKSFCTEVILPFFGGRIPDQANSTSKKLGGPSLPNPASKRSSAALRRPGEPAVRQVPEKKPRKPLGRVSTDTLNNIGKRAPPVLHRSATDSAALIPIIKQEETDQLLPLDRIPLSKSKSQQHVSVVPRPRPSLLQQVSLNKREVDLSALSQANEEKKRKKAKVQEQIREAITTLKRPNRALAVEEIAKHADESFAKAVARGRGSASTHPQRKTVDKSAVAVTATPRHVKATPLPRRRTDYASDEKSTQMVPSSSNRLFAGRAIHAPSSAFAIPQTIQKTSSRHQTSTHPSIEETPSRGFAKYMPAGLVRPPGTLLESPTTSRTVRNAMAVGQTPEKMRRMPTLNETPMRQSVGLSIGHSPAQVEATPLIHRRDERGTGSAGKSIYASLGWDEEYEELS